MPEPITMATVAAVAEAGAAAGEGAAAAVGAAGPAEVGGHLAAVGEAARSASVGGTTEAFVGTLKMDASAVGEAMLLERKHRGRRCPRRWASQRAWSLVGQASRAAWRPRRAAQPSMRDDGLTGSRRTANASGPSP